MFVDLHDLEQSTDLTFDLCIVGAGAAGIAMARRLRGSGLRVAILESGGLSIENEIQMLSEGSISGMQYMPLIAARLRVFGGTTGHWAGQSIPMDEQDFRLREWVPHSGWPISHEQLLAYIPAASDICGVPRGGYRWTDVHEQEALSFPFAPPAFSDSLMRFSRPPRRFGEYFRDELGDAGDSTCFLHANVTEIVTNEAGDRVTHLNLATLKGTKWRINAKKFVLACGGIENSRLLLASNRNNKAGLGNDNDLVGRYFMEHPNFDSGSIRVTSAERAKRLTSPWLTRGSDRLRLEFKLSEAEQERRRILNHTAFFVSSDTKRSHSGEDVGFLGKVWDKFEAIYDQTFETEKETITEREFKLRIRLEQAPVANSRVTLGSEKDALGKPKADLDIRFSDAEGRTVSGVQEALAKELGRAGLGRMRVDFDPSDSKWKDRCGWQIHHCGGTRMHSSPGEGVVDTDCKVFGIDNLWIAGSSVFPTSGHANPTINLVALALRLADHLKGGAAA